MILDRFKLDGNVAVVTGAGRGLGAAIAEAFAQAGADVLIASRTESQLREVAEKVQAAGRQAEVVVADLSDTEVSAALAQKAVDRFGRLDVVVNNVGGTMPKPFLDTTNDDLAEAFSFNVLSGHALLRAAVPHLLKSDNASVINITSTMGRLPGRAFLGYCTAKGALAHYTRTAAMDLSPRIRVNGIAPGSILTSALEVVAGNDEMRNTLEQNTPLHRLGDPDDIAAAAVYLASPAGSFLTGKVLEIDGGLIAPNLDIPLPDLA
ncbi:Putative short chain dehydrogenase/reductase [Mycobacteroides abscessus]|uniref:Short-chain dehydrogenase n=3 Tax=Mycobacteroides abscessus TaxID=36809 RepID=A0A829HN91_9MYCO|nr:SDR family oxidoreductase [Mycobacteroides abscessus]ESV57487.1 short chain dehydrogenase family protein [Mycobacteroides abscessus MAB_082312_2258]ESV65868.1 short chain dehydrogenase family protein [Mycobacteroides abscessus MAB_091912_2446]AFN64683.1 short-chain dehydrogenase [Mycobacteroides abscessus subsp. massiliense str. GO 06]AMU28299.1 short-chain dehydrogenase [Mycobacteroides abscessus]AMU37928.1 short-chain dehydrogenase [Mycobacteroides abscessus]